MEALTEVQERMESSRRAYEEVRAGTLPSLCPHAPLCRTLFPAFDLGRSHCTGYDGLYPTDPLASSFLFPDLWCLGFGDRYFMGK